MSFNYIIISPDGRKKIGKDRLTSVFNMQRFFCHVFCPEKDISIEEKRGYNKIGD